MISIQRSGRTARRSAGRSRIIPRVIRLATEGIEGLRIHTHEGHVGLAKEDGAGIQQILGDVRILRRHLLRERIVSAATSDVDQGLEGSSTSTTGMRHRTGIRQYWTLRVRAPQLITLAATAHKRIMRPAPI